MKDEKRRLIKDIELLRGVILMLVPLMDWAENCAGKEEDVDTKLLQYIDMTRESIRDVMEATVPDVIPESFDNKGEFPQGGK